MAVSMPPDGMVDAPSGKVNAGGIGGIPPACCPPSPKFGMEGIWPGIGDCALVASAATDGHGIMLDEDAAIAGSPI